MHWEKSFQPPVPLHLSCISALLRGKVGAGSLDEEDGKRIETCRPARCWSGLHSLPLPRGRGRDSASRHSREDVLPRQRRRASAQGASLGLKKDLFHPCLYPLDQATSGSGRLKNSFFRPSVLSVGEAQARGCDERALCMEKTWTPPDESGRILFCVVFSLLRRRWLCLR